MDLRGKKILFLGDSITQGAGATKKENVYLEVCAKKLGAKAVNFGVGGTRIAPQITPSVEAFCDEYFLLRAKKMDKEADLVVVFGGTNDFGHGDAPFGRIGDKDPATFCGAYDALMEYLTSIYGKDKVVVVYPLRRYNETSTNGENGRKAEGSKPLAEYYNAEKAIVEKYGLKSVDFWNDGDLNPNTPDGNKNFADGLHPNDIGHRLLGEKLADAIARM